MKYATIEELVNYGIEKINPEENISLPLRDLVLIFKTFEELNRFFHNEDHYAKPENISEFAGNSDSGIYNIIRNIYYKTIPSVLPESIMDLIEEGELSSDAFPLYYNR